MESIVCEIKQLWSVKNSLSMTFNIRRLLT